VAILVEATATLTDEILDLHDRMIGSFSWGLDARVLSQGAGRSVHATLHR
jgi:hypothetical protein